MKVAYNSFKTQFTQAITKQEFVISHNSNNNYSNNNKIT